MKRQSSIVKLSLFSLAIILGFLLAFCSFRIWSFNDYTGFANTIDKSVELTGGVSILYEVEKDSDVKKFGTAMNSTVASLSAVLEDNGYTPTVSKEGFRKIRVNVPNESDASKVLGLLGTAEVSFEIDGTEVLTGEHVSEATATTTTTGYGVAIQLNDDGTKLLKNATASGSATMNIKIGDTDILGSGISISETVMDGQFVISTNTIESARAIAGQIMAGKYSLKLVVKSVQAITEASGKTAVMVGLIASIIGLALVIALSIFLYGLFGVAMSIANLLFSLLMLFMLAMFPWVQLSLPGIIGAIVSLGIVSTFGIIICGRIKDEYSNGKSILSAAHYGFRKSLRQIVDTSLLLAIVSIVLIFFGNVAVKSFAITLLIGLLLAVLCSLVFARMFINYMVRINQSNPKLYRLVRGEGYEDIGADQNDAATEREIQENQRKAAERKRKEASQEGGN